MIDKKQFIILLTGLGLFLTAFLFDGILKGRTNVKRYKEEIENYLWKKEIEVNQLINDTSFIRRRLQYADRPTAEDFLRIESFQKKDFIFCLFTASNNPNSKDSLFFWSNKLILPRLSDLPRAETPFIESKFINFKESQYELRYKCFLNKNKQRITAAALIPLKIDYQSYTGEYLENHFPASGLIPSQLELTDSLQTYDIKNIDQKTICYLNASAATGDLLHDIIVGLLLLFSLILLGVFGHNITRLLLRQYHSPWYGTVFFMSIFLLELSCVYCIENKNLLVSFGLSTNTIGGISGFIRSVPDLLINTIFLLWLSLFIHTELSVKGAEKRSAPVRWLIILGLYFVVVFLYAALIGVLKDLTTNPGMSLSFDDLFDIRIAGVTALVGMGLMIVAIFLLTHRLIVCVSQISMSGVGKFIALDCAIGLIAPVFYSYKLAYFLPLFALCAFVFIYLFHLFTRIEKPGIIWFIIWLLIFSTLPAIFISRFNFDKDEYWLKKYAVELAQEQDQEAIRTIQLVRSNIQEDPFLTAQIPGLTSPFTLDTDRINKILENYFNKELYLTNHYDFHYFGVRRRNVLALKEEEADLETLVRKKEQARQLSNAPGIYFWSEKNGAYAYLTQATAVIPNTANDTLVISMEFSRNDKLNSRVFTELLSHTQFKQLENLKKYSYAIYKNELLVEQNKYATYDKYLPTDNLPPPNSLKIFVKDAAREEAIYNNGRGQVAFVGVELQPSIKVFTLLAYIFILLFLLVCFLSLFDRFVFNFLPPILRFSFSYQDSFRNRIQIPVMFFIFSSFCCIGFATVKFFKSTSENYLKSNLEKISSTIVNNAVEEIEHLQTQDPNGLKMKRFLNKLSEMHQTAIHFFDANGALAATTEDNLFNKGIVVSNRMNPLAFYQLRDGNKKAIRMDENIGRLHYETAYYSVPDSNKHIIGYLELPFYSGDRKIRDNTSGFLSYIMTALILMLLLSFAIVSSMARRIVDPIIEVAEKLKTLTLGRKNEPVINERQDEIGLLLNAYNSKVKELDETFQRLKKMERESAWRDMAKQVAHEIRNPLTPMKLVVQHMEHLRKQRPDQIESYLARSNKMLLDQINSLERIVSEFAQFAKMPQANNERFEINGLVSSINELFVESTRDKLEFELQIPNEPLMVYADRNLLTNAFNNLITNAIQSIPTDRSGRVRVSLYKTSSSAVIKISDNGVGIPKDIQNKIFTPNFTTKSYGNGLGLLITKNIIQSVNGRVYFETQENIGTDFFIELDLIHTI